MACASRQIPEYILDKNVEAGFKEIYVQGPNTLVIIMPGGIEIIKHWSHKPRSEGWTDEMRLAARNRENMRKLENIRKGTEEKIENGI
jgi:hypothetical protein